MLNILLPCIRFPTALESLMSSNWQPYIQSILQCFLRWGVVFPCFEVGVVWRLGTVHLYSCVVCSWYSSLSGAGEAAMGRWKAGKGSIDRLSYVPFTQGLPVFIADGVWHSFIHFCAYCIDTECCIFNRGVADVYEFGLYVYWLNAVQMFLLVLHKCD